MQMRVHSSVLSEFRDRLVQGSLESKLLDTFLDLWKPRGYLRARSRQRTDSTHVLGAVKVLNSLELVGETVRHARSAAGNRHARMAEAAGGSQNGLVGMGNEWRSIASAIRQKRACCPQYHNWRGWVLSADGYPTGSRHAMAFSPPGDPNVVRGLEAPRPL